MKSIIVSLIMLSALGISIVYSNLKSYHDGYVDGGIKGVKIAFDTVNKILDKQLKYDTTNVTELVLIDRDTTIYVLSHKTVVLGK